MPQSPRCHKATLYRGDPVTAQPRGASPPVCEFLQHLRSVYRHHTEVHVREITGPLFSLDLAINALRDLDSRSDAPIHVTVLGPTQVGKSTVVNVLVGREVAGTSPLAGFTRSLQGFGAHLSDRQAAAIRSSLLPAQASPALRRLDAAEGGLTAEAHAIWDTPDFDSHGSREYRNVVTAVSAAADLIVLVVSKEKYSDLTVWQILELLYPLNRPLVVCLNKLDADRELLRSALQRRIEESRYRDRQLPICDLNYVEGGDLAGLLSDPQTQRFADTVRKMLRAQPLTARREGLLRLLDEHWGQWLRPVHHERHAAHRWQQTIEREIEIAVETYATQYLEQSRHYGAMNRTMVQLLALLEIPVLARPLAGARQLLTWPMRKLFSGREAPEVSSVDVELETLASAFEHLLTSLRRNISEGVAGNGHDAVWWRSVARAFDVERADVEQAFAAEAKAYQQAFSAEIERAARALYQRLSERPATLNSLRAARVTADAAGVALAFKTGAIGVNELVLTPAMLSLTSFLAESAVGTYVNSVKADLKEQQRDRVHRLLGDICTQRLTRLTTRLQDDRIFNVGTAQLHEIERLRRTL